MTEESVKGKLTLSGKKTLTLKTTSRPAPSDGRKMVQVEVRKKRVITTPQATAAKPKEIDEVTAQKLKLLAEAKEHDAKRRQEEEAKEALRLQQQAQREQEKQTAVEVAAQKAEKEEPETETEVVESSASQKTKSAAAFKPEKTADN